MSDHSGRVYKFDDTIGTTFRIALHDALLAGATETNIRRWFGVSKPALERWLSGESEPHPAMLPPYIDLLHTEIRKRVPR